MGGSLGRWLSLEHWSSLFSFTGTHESNTLGGEGCLVAIQVRPEDTGKSAGSFVVFLERGDLIPTQLWALFNYFWGFLQLSAHGLHDAIT